MSGAPDLALCDSRLSLRGREDSGVLESLSWPRDTLRGDEAFLQSGWLSEQLCEWKMPVLSALVTHRDRDQARHEGLWTFVVPVVEMEAEQPVSWCHWGGLKSFSGLLEASSTSSEVLQPPAVFLGLCAPYATASV